VRSSAARSAARHPQRQDVRHGSYSRIFALDAKTGAKLWKYEHRLPDGIMPCCDVINRGAALYDNLVIFATLDAQLVALNQDTGEVVWKEKIDDYAAGYSASAAPLIAQGLLLTGVSGGEFGVIGRVEARDPKTGDGLGAPGGRRPHGLHLRQGRQQEGKRRLRHHRQDLARRPVEDRRRGHLAGRHLQRQDRPGLLRHRQPGPLEQPPAQG
jgi:hypothetical protein